MYLSGTYVTIVQDRELTTAKEEPTGHSLSIDRIDVRQSSIHAPERDEVQARCDIRSRCKEFVSPRAMYRASSNGDAIVDQARNGGPKRHLRIVRIALPSACLPDLRCSLPEILAPKWRISSRLGRRPFPLTICARDRPALSPINLHN